MQWSLFNFFNGIAVKALHQFQVGPGAIIPVLKRLLANNMVLYRVNTATMSTVITVNCGPTGLVKMTNFTTVNLDFSRL
ncbi:hypothetical protein MOTE_03780 [Moorella thermoacetica]|uniref:Uncharacterized protein n=1 Tax=Neomoorella thermoacetica TaxID=1525 RepID=A0A1J5P5Y6_NEOTH|nr:hypothetical protein MOTE_03780 [Moorella thermoacetica]